ncbi:MAG: sulfite exporter TauE/SafE family protein [Spirochaetia bacterium]
MDITLTQYIIFIALYSAASFIQGFVGFAFAIVTVPIVSILVSPGFAVGMNAVLGSFNCTVNFIMQHKRVEYKYTAKYLAVSILLLPLGALFLASMNETLIIASLGGTIILLTILSAAMNSGIFTKDNREFVLPEKTGFVFAGISGLLGGAFATPGPPIIAFYYHSGSDKKKARANLQFFFTGISVAIITTHIISGNLNITVLLYALPIIPVVFLFTKLGLTASNKVNPQFFQVILQVFLIILGGFLIYNSIL